MTEESPWLSGPLTEARLSFLPRYHMDMLVDVSAVSKSVCIAKRTCAVMLQVQGMVYCFGSSVCF